MRTLLTGVTIVPVVPRRVVLEDAAIGWDGATGRIVEIAAADEVDESTYDEVRRAPGGVVMPGMVNGHGHAVQSLYRGTQERRPLELWRQYIKARDRRLDGRDTEVAVALASMELLRGGCTTTLEHHYGAFEAPHMGADHVLTAWREVGIRGVYAAMISDVAYGQTVAIDAEGLPPAARAEVDRISNAERAETVADARAFIEDRQGRDPLISFLFGPSAPHRCSADMIVEVARTAEELGIGWHMHVGETAPQRRVTLERTGHTPVGRLADLGVLGPRASLAHGIWFDDADLDLLADTRPTVVHNPASNMKLGSGIARLPDMLERGIDVALGTDGAASNDSQDMFEAMKLTGLLQGVAGVHHDRWPTSWDVLEMATLGGARAVGLQDTIGSLEVGKAADLVVLRRAPALVPLNDVVRQLVFGPARDAIAQVVVGGRTVVDDGHLATIDEDELFDEVQDRVDARAGSFAEADAGVAALESALGELYDGEADG